MYYSFRFYIGKVDFLTDTNVIIQMFDLFAEKLGLAYDYIEYSARNPDGDNYIADAQFRYDPKGKANFAGFKLVPVYMGKTGDSTSPTITATCRCEDSELYSRCIVRCFFPLHDYNVPMIIRVDCQRKREEKITFQQYQELLSGLNELGYHVDNSFCHLYRRKNECATLDGGNVGLFCIFTTWKERKNIRNCINHRMKGYLGHITDVFCANSIRRDYLDDSLIEKISSIVGAGNVATVGDSVVFSLSQMKKMSVDYQLRYHRRIGELREVIRHCNQSNKSL